MEKLIDFKRSKILYVRLSPADSDASNMMIFNLSDKSFTIDRIDDCNYSFGLRYCHDNMYREMGNGTIEQYGYLIPFIGKRLNTRDGCLI